MNISHFLAVPPISYVFLVCALVILVAAIIVPLVVKMPYNKALSVILWAGVAAVSAIAVSVITHFIHAQAMTSELQDAVASGYGIEFDDQPIRDIKHIDDAEIHSFTGVRDGEKVMFGVSLDDENILSIFENVNAEYVELNPQS